MKKVLTLCLVLLLLTGCFAACGKKDPTPTPAVTEEPTPVPTQIPVEDPTPTPTPEPPQVYLKDVFAEHGIKVGTCLTTQMISNSKTKELLLGHYNSVTMENHMKPDYILSQAKSIEKGDIVVEFNKDMITMLDFAKENGLAVRGHTLVWYSQTPQWIFYDNFDNKTGKLVTREVMLKRMESYIKQVFEKLTEQGYADLFYAYDVVNEAWMEDGSMRSQMNLWYEVVGDDYIWHAFNFANKYAPENIALFYNDYNEQFKTDTLEKFVKTLVDKDGNYLIDGIGFQAHLYTEDSLTAYFKTVDQLSKLGLTIELTELDVCLGKYNAPQMASDENKAKQGRFVYDLIKGIFDRKDAGTLKIDSLTFWGITDGASWRKSYSPLLFSSAYSRKPAFFGAAQMKEYAGFNQ
ncbi:MAG: endo-1,4-beta-xylanase [Lachnospiraceae bacterium]|nr:endo-1,4-beta-xylanase [Lachnospiraceae bacterium]